MVVRVAMTSAMPDASVVDDSRPVVDIAGLRMRADDDPTHVLSVQCRFCSEFELSDKVGKGWTQRRQVSIEKRL